MHGPDSAAEAAALRAQINRIGAFLEAQPAIHPAIGVCPLFVNSGSARRLAEDFALVGGFGVGYWPADWLDRRNGHIVLDGEIGYAWVDVNQIQLDNSRFTITDARGPMHETVPVTHLMHGFPVYGGLQFIVTRHDRRLFRPATVERLLRWQLGAIETALPRSAIQLVSLRTFDLDPGQPAGRRDLDARASFFWGVDWQRLRREVMGGPRRDQAGRGKGSTAVVSRQWHSYYPAPHRPENRRCEPNAAACCRPAPPCSCPRWAPAPARRPPSRR